MNTVISQHTNFKQASRSVGRLARRATTDKWRLSAECGQWDVLLETLIAAGDFTVHAYVTEAFVTSHNFI